MKVKEAMSKSPITLQQSARIKDVIKPIFNLGISGVIIVNKRKVVGIVTEDDILHRLFPSIKEVMEDLHGAMTLDDLGERLETLLNEPVSSIMTKRVLCIRETTSLKNALSKMLVNRYSYLPIINEKRNLIGVITQGDIFKILVESEVPYDDEEEYHDWLSNNIDAISAGLSRYDAEVESLSRMLKRHKTTHVFDIGSGSGSHVLRLANNGYHAIGLERSRKMARVALRKRKERTKQVQKRSNFFSVQSYVEFLAQYEGPVDAFIMMGDALSHIPDNYKNVLRRAYKTLDKGGVLVLQLSNIEGVINERRRFYTFSISTSKYDKRQEYAFLGFVDPPRRGNKNATLTISVLINNGKRWRYKGLNSTPIAYLTKKSVVDLLREAGFKTIQIYGSRFGSELFNRPFDVDRDDWLNVVAVK